MLGLMTDFLQLLVMLQQPDEGVILEKIPGRLLPLFLSCLEFQSLNHV